MKPALGFVPSRDASVPKPKALRPRNGSLEAPNEGLYVKQEMPCTLKEELGLQNEALGPPIEYLDPQNEALGSPRCRLDPKNEPMVPEKEALEGKE